MYKKAINIPLSPDEEYQASQHVGRSLFSMLQLAKEQERRRRQMMQRPGVGEEDPGVLSIPIPENLLPNKTAEHGDSEDGGIFANALSHAGKHPVRLLLGGQQGFRDAKKDYYIQQKAQIQKDLMDAQKEYINTLSRIKVASENTSTPCVDAFCSGAAHSVIFPKVAYSHEVNIEDDSLKQLLGDIREKMLHPFKPIGEAAAGGLLNTAAGTALATGLMRKQMRENPDEYMDETLPTRVELKPYH